jgi:hypothetical protein
MKRNINLIFIVLLFFVFIFRLLCSLTNEFWFADEDVLQIYLIGLKFFTTSGYPYFGPDLVYTHAQIPGGLQAILVSALWFIIELPESPQILLNIILFISLLFLCWYLRKRVPSFPPVLLYSFVMLTTWPACYFTRVINPSYVVTGAIIFFIGIYEIYPQLRMGVIPRNLAFFMIGFGLFWIYQLHMSWVLLIPYIIYSFYINLKEFGIKILLKNFFYFCLGCLTIGSLAIPTFIEYGMSSPGSTGSFSVVKFYPEHLLSIFDYLAKFLSYICYDTTRFIGGDTSQRLQFLKDNLWAAPAIIYVTLAGIAQAILMLYMFFRRKNTTIKWKGVKYITLSAFIFIWLSSMFSMATPGGHATTLMFPVVAIYFIHSVNDLTQKKIIRNITYSVILASIIMYAAIAINNFNSISMYKNRDVIVKALEEKDYRLVGLRRYEK